MGNSLTLIEIQQTLRWIHQISTSGENHVYLDIHGIALIMGCLACVLNPDKDKPILNSTEETILNLIREYYYTQLITKFPYHSHFKESYELFKNFSWAWRALDCLETGQICLPATEVFYQRIYFYIQKLASQATGLYLPVVQLADTHANRPWLIQPSNEAYLGYRYKTNIGFLPRFNTSSITSRPLLLIKPQLIEPAEFMKQVQERDKGKTDNLWGKSK